MDRQELNFSAAGDAGQVFTALATRYEVLAGAAVLGSWTCLDTPDWRLHDAGFTLREARSGRRAELVLGSGGAPANEGVAGGGGGAAPLIVETRGRSWPARIAGIGDSPVRDQIAGPVGVRALLPLAEVDVRSIPLTLRDDEGKTRVRVRVDQQRLRGPGHHPLPLRVLITALRGYEADAQRCTDLLTAAMPRLEDDRDAITIAMATAGHEPGVPAVPAVALDPGAPAVRSLAAVLRRYLQIAQQACPGALDDLDTEYLHDLRTSVRATRSILKLAGELLPSSQVEAFSAEFAWVGQLTTPMRDLDVMLLLLDGHGDIDLDGLEGLDVLRRYLTSRRSRALRTLREQLTSSRGKSLGRRWAALLDQADEGHSIATRDHAATLVRRAYQRVTKLAHGVTAETDADDLHHLRKRCKQMRYLLDGYASVFEPEAFAHTRKALKKLQDSLGGIQDAHVQRALLADCAATLARRQEPPVGTLLAIGALRDRLAVRDETAREGLVERLAGFCDDATARRVRGLASGG